MEIITATAEACRENQVKRCVWRLLPRIAHGKHLAILPRDQHRTPLASDSPASANRSHQEDWDHVGLVHSADLAIWHDAWHVARA